MALEPCRECGNIVSTEAPICPHCGVARPGGERGRCYGCGETVTVVDRFCPLCGVQDPLIPLAEAKRRGPSAGIKDRAEALVDTGKAVESIGCLLTLLITVPIIVIVIAIILLG